MFAQFGVSLGDVTVEKERESVEYEVSTPKLACQWNGVGRENVDISQFLWTNVAITHFDVRLGC